MIEYPVPDGFESTRFDVDAVATPLELMPPAARNRTVEYPSRYRFDRNTTPFLSCAFTQFGSCWYAFTVGFEPRAPILCWMMASWFAVTVPVLVAARRTASSSAVVPSWAVGVS